ncbi:MAG: KH domain-containing protein [Anaerolineales bacterium]|nr:KH domain-containing protein [Anaerolineales bacterium]
MYRDLTEFIVKSIVDEPDAVRVTEMESRNNIVLEVSVADDDMGRVIGKGGRVINAIRTLVQIPGARADKRISLEIV